MTIATPQMLERAVAAICPDIQERTNAFSSIRSEAQLWWELSCCLLSSQVTYEMAVAAANTIAEKGLLLVPPATTSLPLALRAVLKEGINIKNKQVTYRFYSSKSTQLAETRNAVYHNATSLSSLLESFHSATDARDWFVKNAPGLGPKQASMFLRNIGKTYDLAIIDRHVLKYMEVLGISKSETRYVSGLTTYRKHENVLREYANRLGFAVGLMDWAIWIVMRAARGNEQSLEVG